MDCARWWANLNVGTRALVESVVEQPQKVCNSGGLHRAGIGP